MLRLYPPNVKEKQKKEEKEAIEVKRWQRNTLDKILKSIDHMDFKTKQEKEKIVYEMLI